MTQDEFDPGDFEEILLKIANRIKTTKDLVAISTLVGTIEDETKQKIQPELVEKTMIRMYKEGFMEQVEPGMVKVLNLGNIDLEEY